MTYVVQLYNS